MLVVRLTGGLGNQMFQYAFGKSMAKQLNQIVNYYYNEIENITDRQFELNEFQNIPQLISAAEYSKFPQGRLKDIITRFNFSNYQTLHENNFSIDKIKTKKHNLIIGYWQNYQLIETNKQLIQNSFQIKKTLENSINTIIENKNLDFNNSVGIHIRLGDYLKNPTVHNIHGVLPKTYYQAAINAISQQIDNPKFYIFTDSPELITTDFEIDNFEIIKPNTSIIDLILLSKCKHQIIANSSFSWWAAWLNKNPNKIVFAPKQWYKNPPETFNINQLILPTWKQL